MYVKDRLSKYVLHTKASSCDGLYCLFCRPTSAISLLKSPHSICIWFGCAFICALMFCCIIEISLISSLCEGMYKCNISHGCSGWIFMCMICKYGEMFAEDGIFIMFRGNAYF